MATLITQAVPHSGLNPVAYTSGAALALTNNQAPTGPGLFLLVKNTSGASVTVTLRIPDSITIDGLVPPTSMDPAWNVASNGEATIPLVAARYSDPANSGNALFDLSSNAAGVNCACLYVGS